MLADNVSPPPKACSVLFGAQQVHFAGEFAAQLRWMWQIDLGDVLGWYACTVGVLLPVPYVDGACQQHFRFGWISVGEPVSSVTADWKPWQPANKMKTRATSKIKEKKHETAPTSRS